MFRRWLVSLSFRAKEEVQLQERSTLVRSYELDALRGIAAFVVVLHHMRLTTHDYPPSALLVPFFSGSQSVNLFFVLSGFVLSLPYYAGKTSAYPVYLSRRLVRIYIPFAVAASLSILGAWLFRNHSLQLSEWFGHTWHGPITWRLIGQQFVMEPISNFNVALWSLGYEMQMSILMPLISYGVKRWNSVLILCLCIVAAFCLPRNVLAFLAPIYPSVQVGCLFVLGATLALHRVTLRNNLRRCARGGWLILAGAVFLYCGYLERLVPAPLAHLLKFRGMLISGVGAAGVIICALELRPLSSLLRHGSLEYLGKISYSLYLTHSLVLLALVDLFYGKTANAVLYLAALLGALLVAHLFFHTIEEPCLQWSKRLKTRRIVSIDSEPVRFL